MRTYDERIMNIRAKAKATKKAYRAITASLVTLSLFAVVIGGMLLHPELFLRIGKEPTYGPALQQPSGNYSPMDDPVMTHPTMMGPTSPEDVIGFQVNDLKLHSGEDWGFGPVVIRSVEELELFCDRQAALYNDWPPTLSKPIDSIVELTAKYDNTFFARQSLILLMKQEGSGSNKLQVTEVFWMDSDSIMVTVDRILPGIGTADMAYWYLFIETDEVLPESADVWVQYSINRESWQEPAYDRMQIPVKTQRIYYGAPDMDAKYPRTDVIASVEELQAYLAGLDADLSVETQQYDAAFFETHTLLALWNPVGSSSVEYYVNEVWRMSDGGISIRGQCTSPTICNEDIMSWLIFIEAETDISHYAKITVEYETIEEAIPPERPEDTNLEFWIGQDMADVDFSSHDEVYGWFGAREYLGKGYQMLPGEDGEQQYPQHYVSYLIGAFPDESDGGSFVTRIKITDPNVTLYGLTTQSDEAEFAAVFIAMGYGVYEEYGRCIAKKDGITFTLEMDAFITITAQVTNKECIIY